MESKQYNGWYNYETWLVNLWMSNDQDTHDLVAQWNQDDKKLYTTKRDSPSYSQDVVDFSDYLEEYVRDMNPLADSACMFSDLLGAALSEVNWREIADHWISDYLADNPNEYTLEYAVDWGNVSWLKYRAWLCVESGDMAESFWELFNACIQDVIDNSTEDQNSVVISWKSYKPSGIYITL